MKINQGEKMRNPIPRVAAIHDLSGFSRAFLTVIIPILSTLEVQVCPLPTAVFWDRLDRWILSLISSKHLLNPGNMWS